MQHTRLTHENCEQLSCNICDLFVCAVCNGAEGSLSTECCGRRLTVEEEDNIYDEKIDFINGEWVKKTQNS
jgi:hypothetical protein